MKKSKARWSSLEHKIHRQWRKHFGASHKFTGETWAVGLSGGADSVALLSVLQALQSTYNYSLLAIYLHHGQGGSPGYRSKAEKFCRKLCQNLQVELLVKKYSGSKLKSEEAMRNWRYQSFDSILTQYSVSRLLLAHHQDDLLETRIMRLLRGTGLQGLLAMKMVDGEKLRPFLECSRQELLDYLRSKKQSWVEDPTNRDVKYLRNWVRHKWLTQLERRLPGAKESLARSLAHLAEPAFDAVTRQILPEIKVPLANLLSLSSSERESMAHQIMTQLGLRPTSGQIKEIMKRLDRPQKVHSFIVGGARWYIRRGDILCYRATSA